MSARTCTSHCRACGRHFHGDGAFDAHRVFQDTKVVDWELRMCLDPSDSERFEPFADGDGECRIGEHQVDVVVWRLRMTESQRRSIEKFKEARKSSRGGQSAA